MKRISVVLAISVIIFFAHQDVKAHPGNTDSYGKHTCYTNCEKWGLEYGEYHGHDDIDSSSSSDSGDVSSDTIYTDDIPVMTEEEQEAHYEELQSDGYDIGYQDGYNGERFEDFHEEKYAELSNSDYSWYEVGYEAGYNEGKSNKAAVIQNQQEEDYQAGEKLGYEQGQTDFENKAVQQNQQTNASQTEYWNKGYAAGYKKVIQVMQLAINAKKEGYQQGLTHKDEDIHIPSKYSSENETKQAFQEGFKKGEDERIKHLQEIYEKEGYEAGYNQQTFIIPDDVPELYKISFKQGFEKGYKAKEEEEQEEEERNKRNKQILIGGLALVPTGIVGGYYLYRRKSNQ